MEDGYQSSSDEEIEESNDRQRPYNDTEAMEAKLKLIKSDLKWIEHLDITVDLKDVNIPGAEEKNDDKGLKSGVQDDFKREMLFYCQSQIAAKEALARLRDMKIPTERPEDYFAEMVKTDTHMHKIRQKLADRKEGMEKSEKAKKQRQLKKIGKKVQQDVLKKRQDDKKKMLATVDKIKKGKGRLEDLTNGKSDDMFNVTNDGNNRNKGGNKRKRKDEKFGFGGKKRKVKKNSSESAGEMTAYKSHIHGKAKNVNPQKFGNKNKKNKNDGNKRLGKARRVQMRGNKR